MIKTLFFTLIIATIIPIKSSAQIFEGMGIKGGLNYNSNGEYKALNSLNTIGSEKEVGYHFGFFGKIGKDIYFRPEFIYTVTKSDYNGEDFDMHKIDIPLLVGFQVLKKFSVFAGPSFQYILDSKFDNEIMKGVQKEFPIGLNIGAGFNISRYGIDLRYERGFSKNEAIFISENFNGFDRLDTRPEQLILSFTLFLF